MTKREQKIEYTVHPDSLIYAGLAEAYALADSASHQSTFTLRLRAMLAKLVSPASSADQSQAKSQHKIDRYERN